MKLSTISRREQVRSWPLYLLAAPATVAVWSGWVGLGEMTGFGKVHPLPGIADGLQINTAITLPIGVEAYAAYALGAWLTRNPLSKGTRKFARLSAIGALILGACGQVAYHLLTMAPPVYDKLGHLIPPSAPWGITTLVACFPVLVLGMGATLAHLIHRDSETKPNTAQVRVGEVRVVQGSDPTTVQEAPVRNLPVICSRSVRSHPNLNQRTANLGPNRHVAEPEPRAELRPPAKANRAGSEPQPEVTAAPEPRTTANTAATNLGDRASKKALEVQQVLNLIEELGPAAVTLTEVRNRFGLTKTTAWQRLTAARELWNQRAAS